MPNQRLFIDPRELLLPTTRQDGPDPLKLHAQAKRFGGSNLGMQPVEVNETLDGFLIIMNGLTRAYRIAWLGAGKDVEVEVTDIMPIQGAGRKTIGDLMP